MHRPRVFWAALLAILGTLIYSYLQFVGQRDCTAAGGHWTRGSLFSFTCNIPTKT